MSRNCSAKMAMSQYVYDHYQAITSRKFMAVETWWDQVIIIICIKNQFIRIIFSCEILRFFILWYQILGHNAPDSVHAIFATLVPGFSSPIPEHPGLAALWNNHSSSINLHENLLSKSLTNDINNIVYTKIIIF